ncbi:MAG: DUF1028 domain-containing protein [Herpetosiphonaceae bacterium]|nr:DUF1028 domain-containing protein [Herpetosiphonaceae bacterium]
MHVPYIATFSIVARDPHNGDLAVAVQSKFLAVGSVVSWAQAGAGVLATQALANVGYGPDGLALLVEGKSAPEVVAQLTAADAGRDQRQLGVVDREGRAAAWTGSGCHAWAGHTVGAGFSCQGNILAGPAVTEAMAATFLKSSGEVAERCVAALAAGQAAGGDRRGRQSAALYVARAKGSYGGVLDRYIDLRVDDHADPITELERLLKLHRFYLTRPPATAYQPITPALAGELQDLLRDLGYYDGPTTGNYDEVTRAALLTLGGFENLEERLVEDARIDGETLNFLRAKRAKR